MNTSFYCGNRARLSESLAPAEIAVFFSGEEIRKTNDEYYPFFADRNFVYLTGIRQKQSILLIVRDKQSVRECLYLLPSDPMAERWTGRRLTAAEARDISGVEDIRNIDRFEQDLHMLLTGGSIQSLALDLYRVSPQDIDRPAHRFLSLAMREWPYLTIQNANTILRRLRLIKQPCEIESLRKAEEITRSGILAMMHASHPGMYEYQYKAEFDRAIGQYSPDGSGFPSIISAGKNNFCIHYYAYSGQAADGDMVLNDVGAQWDGLITDVSRGWPCNGHFSPRQKLLYECALATSDHMFSILKPGYPMREVDAEIRRFNAARLVEAGVLQEASAIGTLMWHGGAHHIGFDVHDVVESPAEIAPGMVFCIDVGIYHEEWGIGFRLEDNCLITEDGCENLSAAIPRTVDAIEVEMAKQF